MSQPAKRISAPRRLSPSEIESLRAHAKETGAKIRELIARDEAAKARKDPPA